MGTKGLRNLAIVSFVFSLGLLLWAGYIAYGRVAPIPDMTVNDQVVFSAAEIKAGQDVFQRYGLMDHGSVWGHGTLRGPDFSATTLHMVGVEMRTFYATIASVSPGEIDSQVIAEIKDNYYDPASNTLPLTPGQAYAFHMVRDHWASLLRNGDAKAAAQDKPSYGFLPNTIPTDEEAKAVGTFFLWTAWAAGVNRPGKNYSYTNNWPADNSVGNVAPQSAVFWSILSILSLMGVLGLIIYVVHRYEFFYGPSRAVDASYALMKMPLTASQRATGKFFLVAGLLFLVQILNGGLMANYTVRPATFYLQAVGNVYPYSWAKTWHVQLAIFWIAISWIGTSIFVAPAIAGREPKGQHHLVNILFWATFLVVVGSLTGEVLSIKGVLGKNWWYWFGDQGWEYLELGKVWHIALFGGLIFWLVIVYRVLAQTIRQKAMDAEHRALIVFYVIAAILIVFFFGFGMMYWRGTHLTIADYWRWFVVHIWVESIFEFFGVAVVALFLVTLGLVTAKSALRVAYLTATITFLSGIAGVAHHYFWFGGPNFWLAIGGTFSSLEPIPLILLVVRAWKEYRSIGKEGREFPYRWPLYFLVASSFWNFLGAGVFGFMINLPIINYYEHATYLTNNHAHTALFGVYGMLAVALILFSWRGLVDSKHWNSRLLRVSFWGLNGGLFLMFSTSLLPIGLLQLWHVSKDGFWWARSAEFYRLPSVRMIANWRIVSDSIIIVFGALPLLWFLVSTFPRLRKVGQAGTAEPGK